MDVRLEVAASFRPRRSPGRGAAEEVREDVAEAAEAASPAGRAAAEAAAGKAPAEDPATGVVGLALLGIGEDPVRALDLLEALLGGRVALVGVRVVLAGKLPVGLLDLIVRGLLVDAERLVRILDRRHQPETTTRAGRRTVPFAR